MPKFKTNRAAAKRFRKRGNGGLKRRCAFRRHILTKKTTARKRKLRGPTEVHETNAKAVNLLLPY